MVSEAVLQFREGGRVWGWIGANPSELRAKQAGEKLLFKTLELHMALAYVCLTMTHYGNQKSMLPLKEWHDFSELLGTGDAPIDFSGTCCVFGISES